MNRTNRILSVLCFTALIAACDPVSTVPSDLFVDGSVPTGGAGGTTATTTTPKPVCVPYDSGPCTGAFGAGYHVCNGDGMSYGTCTPIVTATGGTGGTSTTVVSTGGSTTVIATNSNTSTATSTSTGTTPVCDKDHVGLVVNGMECMESTVTINVYTWYPVSTNTNTSTSTSTGTRTPSNPVPFNPSNTVCGYGGQSTLVCSSKWFTQSPPSSADLITWDGSAEVGLRINASMASDGNYYFGLGGHLVGIYRTWYTRANYSQYDAADGATYGLPGNLQLISSAARLWLRCDISGCNTGGACGCDVRFRLNYDGTIDPAGDGTGL